MRILITVGSLRGKVLPVIKKRRRTHRGGRYPTNEPRFDYAITAPDCGPGTIWWYQDIEVEEMSEPLPAVGSDMEPGT